MKKKGFTLIEIMVVVSIMAVISGGSIVAFNRLREKRQVLAEAEKVVLQLKKARSRAQAGEKPTACIGELVGYQVSLSDDEVKLQVRCGNVVDVKTVKLLEGEVVGSDVVEFNALGVGSDVDVVICGNNGRYGYTIEVSGSGVVESPSEYGGC